MVGQRMPAPRTTDALTPLERSGIPLQLTWQRGAVQFQWQLDQISIEGLWISASSLDDDRCSGEMYRRLLLQRSL